MKQKKSLAVFGTGSDVGKSIVGAAICRSLVDRGKNVAPFKAQNMSNNSGITPEGLEMGRAQIVQAEAAKMAPHIDMNPVLLKPTGELKSQVVLNGKAVENNTAKEYHFKKDFYFKEACEAYDRLDGRHDIVVLEGAGSCAEVNLMHSDIVNFPMAEYANSDVILVADIHRGGVFGQIVGTLACLPEKYKKMVKGFIINRFRGDISLFKDGVSWIEEKTGLPVFGVLPWYTHFRIDAEDSVEIEACNSISLLNDNEPAIAVIRLSHISNFTDFHALSAVKGIQVVFVESPVDLTQFSAVILPGSKNTRDDIDWLRSTGWDKKIQTYAAQKGNILGICGGYQILGETIDDPEGHEGTPGMTNGLNLLPVKTVLKAPKTTTISSFAWDGQEAEGYEIHMGYTKRLSGSPLFKVRKRNQEDCDEFDGSVSEDHKIIGTYMHGMFDSPQITKKWLESIGLGEHISIKDDAVSEKEQNYILLKEHFEQYIDMDAILKVLDLPRT